MTTTFDSHKNLAYSAVATAPSPATSGVSLAVTAGDGAKFPTPPFNATVWPGGGATASQANAEIVRVTGVATDTLTIVRAQEGTTAQSVAVGYQIALTATAKALTDIEGAVNATLGGDLAGTLPNPTIAAGAVTQRIPTVYGTSGQQTTTSTSDVDLADMSVTLTTTGGDLECSAQVVVGNSASASGNVFVTLYLDGAQKGLVALATPGLNNWDTLSLFAHWGSVAAGSHTVKVRWHVDAGTGVANGNQRALTVTELKR